MRFLSLGLCVALLGCASDSVINAAKQAQTSMLGMSRDSVIECAGIPTKTARTASAEFIEYMDGDGSSTSLSNGAMSVNLGTAFCSTMIKLEGGRVTNVRFMSENPGAFTWELHAPYYCGRRLSACVPRN